MKEQGNEMATPLFLFEDHCESYLHWKDAGLKDLCVVHVDAHLDVADEGLTKDTLEKLAACKTSAEMEEYRKNEDILWGGFHPGNYLYPAMKDGTVSRMIWVIPEHLPGGNEFLPWAREHLQEWMELSLSDYDSLHNEGNKIAGKLAGFDFEICFLKDLDCSSDNIVWDIDTDYLIDNYDYAWKSPMELVECLKKKAPNPKMITIAYSVNGGYLSPEQKYLGDMVKLAIEEGIPDDMAENYNHILKGDNIISDYRELSRYSDINSGSSTPGSSVLQNGKNYPPPECNLLQNGENNTPPSPVKDYDTAAAYFRKAAETSLFKPYMDLRMSNIYKEQGDEKKAKEFREKAALQRPDLILPAYDIAMIHFRRKEYNRALELLTQAKEADEIHFLMSHFLSGVIYQKQNKDKEALIHWEEIIHSDYFTNWEQSVRAHITFIVGATMLKVGRLEEALNQLNFSIALNPENHKAYCQRGRVYLEMDKLENAARDFRKYLFIKPDSIESLEVHLLLAETYRRQKKDGMEKREVRTVLKKDTTGFYSMKARLGRYL